MKKTSIIFLLFIYVLSPACKEEEISPKEIILGKWEEIYLGNGEERPLLVPSGYRQFLSDSVLIEYDYATKKSFVKKYWIDSLLHIGTQRQDGFWLIFDYKYQFYDDNLRLETNNFSTIFNVSISKKIKSPL
ncbi:hypothetical protein [Flectobacillus rivi]|uniref:Lipocalin-like domain-containing protein n=1 Tax=Flectobacillus rivi TaxID=2984209 RepID=A0ABT6Z8C2_9BACT|nr:hypothetical protein [Flectobacillus rivi]MDI9877381.1 hypothetical protein [Flectobacillus rivi]